jgi:hypothetical protein
MAEDHSATRKKHLYLFLRKGSGLSLLSLED